LRAPLIVCALAVALLPAVAALGAAGGQQNGTGPQPSPAPSGSASAPSTNPFASPTPTGTPGPIGNGYVILGYGSASAAGGVIPPRIATTAPPSPLPASNASGFYAEVTGRFSTTYAALLRFHDYSIHGGDNAVVNLSEGALLYMPGGGRVALGIGYGSWQRSSGNTSANSVGVAATFLPDFRRPVSPYAGVFYYPSARMLGGSAGITAANAGIVVRPGSSGLLFRLGYEYLGYPNQNSSPTSLSALQIGLGASF
jgi:hypothetical protein